MAIALVTGANGFIGSHLVHELLARGDRVRCLVRRSSNLASLAGLDFEVFIGDVRDPETLVPAVRGVEYIYHLAAVLMAAAEADFHETNTQGTRHLLSAALEHAPDAKRFVLVSSQAAAGPSSGLTPLDERESDISQVFPAMRAGLQPRLGLRTRHLVLVYVGDLVGGIADAATSPATIGQTYFLLGFGLVLGTLAMLLRQAGDIVQFLSGSVLAGAAEVANDFSLIPGARWTFAPGWPLGITDHWWRSLLLGCAGGIFVLIVNALARAVYRRRARYG